MAWIGTTCGSSSRWADRSYAAAARQSVSQAVRAQRRVVQPTKAGQDALRRAERIEIEVQSTEGSLRDTSRGRPVACA